jgi:hypothetical protein
MKTYEDYTDCRGEKDIYYIERKYKSGFPSQFEYRVCKGFLAKNMNNINSLWLKIASVLGCVDCVNVEVL